MSGGVIVVRGVSVVRGGRDLLAGVDLAVSAGQVVAVLGGSGSGKTTLLRAMTYLTPFDDGTIEASGVTLRPGMDERRDGGLLRAVRQRVGMVFQQFHLFAHRTALENVMAGPVIVKGVSQAIARTAAMALLDRVGLASHAGARPAALSGGQQQRVAIARALAMEPVALLFDEPTSALDPQRRDDVAEVIEGLRDQGYALVVVTHDIAFARRVADEVVVIDAGVVAETGPPAAVLERPRSVAARALVERM